MKLYEFESGVLELGKSSFINQNHIKVIVYHNKNSYKSSDNRNLNWHTLHGTHYLKYLSLDGIAFKI